MDRHQTDATQQAARRPNHLAREPYRLFKVIGQNALQRAVHVSARIVPRKPCHLPSDYIKPTSEIGTFRTWRDVHLESAFGGIDGVIGRPSLWIAEDLWVLRFRLMVKRGPLL